VTLTEAPAKVPNSVKLLKQANAEIETLIEAMRLIEANSAILDCFDSGSVGSTIGVQIFLHGPPPNVLDFCRAVGGSWKKTTTGTRIDYSLDGKFNISIFGAEAVESSTEVLKL